MKKWFTVLAALALVVLCAVLLPNEAKAASESDLTFKLNSDGKSYYVSDCKESASGELIIPATYNGKPVTRIGEAAFNGCYGLTSIIIPNSVTSIDAYAFYWCFRLTNIVYCGTAEQWQLIKIDSSNTEIDDMIRYHSFTNGNCYVPQTCSACGIVGDYVHTWDASCTTTKTCKICGIAENTALVHKWKSATCTTPKTCIACGITEGLSLHDSVGTFCTDCGKYGTCGSNLTWVLDSDGVLTISGTGAMKDFSYRYNTIVEAINGAPWWLNYGSIREVVIEDGVTSIGSWAFYDCYNLTSVTIPDSVTSIGYCTFCFSGLTSITIPDSVISIDEGAFYGCPKLTSVIYCGTEEQWDKINIDTYNTELTQVERSYHNLTIGDCYTPQTCTICGATGEYCHTWTGATCTTAKTCGICGATEGAALGHKWQNATCTTPKTCTACGATEGSPNGHKYDDRYDVSCNSCGFNRLSKDAALNFLADPGLSFQDYIGMQVLVPNTTANKYDSIWVQAVQADPDGDVTAVLESAPYFGIYQLFEQQVLSWSMTEKVTLTLYAEKDGLIYVGQTVSASVQDLAMTKILSYYSAGNTKAVTALVDMLNYGTAVQVAFSHNAGSLPTAKLGIFSDLGTLDIPACEAANNKTGAAAVSVLKDSISMQAKVEIQLLFAVDISNYTAKATVGGKDAPVVIDTETMGDYGWTLVRVAIGAANMRDTYTIALYDADGNPVTQVYEVSVEAYGKTQLTSAYRDVVIAMMRYGDSVAAL